MKKHGIDFADVWQIYDYDTVMDFDDRFDYGEIRYLTFGILRGSVIVIAHTIVDGIFRIISARKAEKYEQEIYFKNTRN